MILGVRERGRREKEEVELAGICGIWEETPAPVSDVAKRQWFFPG